MEHRVLGVVGASGGLGASTLAVALGVRAAASVGATVCVDGSFERGGLDVTACIEHEPGLRWPDLSDVRGEVDGADLLRSLPADGVARVLAARGSPVPDDVVGACLGALSSICALTVLDLGGSLRWVAECTDVLLVCGPTARHLADAAAVAAEVGRLGVPVRLVLRAGRREPVTGEQVAQHLDLPHAGTLVDDSQVVADAERARAPGTRRNGAFVTAVDRLLAELEVCAGRGVDADRVSA
ncbi:hypothetical protein [Phycicoccus sp. Root563]|uniref:hypothetical protein n=1 Tax=Phycicoccus sp. Root563 TaxID=1736562 RepID=UPI0012FC0608|nr:hypothetical protein [Phycicoccus sp. Root563]